MPMLIYSVMSLKSKKGSYHIDVGYTVHIIGGVPQKIPLTPAKEPTPADSPKVVRRTVRSRRIPNRRVSCKDLGKGDCQGWLYKKRNASGSILSSKWAKRWFVLKKSDLYYYKNVEDQMAQGVIHLPGFTVSPADVKSKRYAFKVYTSGTEFYFASDRQEDMVKWMNKMGVAAISFDTSGHTVAGFTPPERITEESKEALAQFSESEDESDKESVVSNTSKSSSPSSPESQKSQQSRGLTIRSSPEHASPEHKSVSQDDSTPPVVRRHPSSASRSRVDAPEDDIRKTLNNIKIGALTLDGSDLKAKRISKLSKVNPNNSAKNERKSVEIDKARKLASIQRTIKAKEHDVNTIDQFLNKTNISPEDLREFQEYHPHLCTDPDKYEESHV